MFGHDVLSSMATKLDNEDLPSVDKFFSILRRKSCICATISRRIEGSESVILMIIGLVVTEESVSNSSTHVRYKLSG